MLQDDRERCRSRKPWVLAWLREDRPLLPTSMKWTRALLGFGYLVVVFSFATLLSNVLISGRGGWGSGSEPREALLLQEVVDRLAEAQGIEGDSLYRLAAAALVRASNDPYAELMDPAAYEAFSIENGRGFGGIGVHLDVRAGGLVIMEPRERGPAARAGLLRGDEILEIDGQKTEGWSSEEAVKSLRGPIGTAVTLRVRRNEKVLPDLFRLQREEIHIASVPLFYRTRDGIGVVQYRSFGQAAHIELRGALESLGVDSLRGLVLDLRGNPGGLLDEALLSADLFLEEGAVLARTREVASQEETVYRAEDREHHPRLPLVVLVDGESASSAEILAGALQDHDRALVVGARSYGKGSVQQVFPLRSGHTLKVTTARWFTPVGREIDRPQEGSEKLRPDSGTVQEKSFRSLGGRPLRGGGGIYPDVVVSDSLLAMRARGIVRFPSGEEWIRARDLLYRLAARHSRTHALPDPFFSVPETLLGELVAEMRRERIGSAHLSDPFLLHFLRFELGRQIAQSEWGELGARQYEDRWDTQVQEALRQLRVQGEGGPRLPAAASSTPHAPPPSALRASGRR